MMMGFIPLLLGGFGLIAAIVFHANIYFPIVLSVFIFIAVSLFLVHRYKIKRLGLLILLIWLVYALPFIHIVPYLWFDFDVENPLLLWGLAVNPYMTNEKIISATAMLGAVGALAIALGSSMSSSRIKEDRGLSPDGAKRAFRTMAVPIWLIWVIFGVALSWLAAPQDSLFAARYTASESALDNANYGSAWMASYIILSFAFCDAILEKRPIEKKLKWGLILASIAFVVIVLQLLRGNRESVTWVFALALVYFYWAAGLTQRRGFKIPWSKVTLWGGALVAVSMLLGALRHSLVGINNISEVFDLLSGLAASGQIGFSNLLHGTWSAVLLTPLSVAGDYVYQQLEFKYGQDYLNLLLSIPPGFLADAIGYQRPINALQGPAWEMRYGIGGTHATVVPFMNFGMLGVLIIPALWSYAIARFEKSATRKVSVVNLSLLATLAMASAHWLWYGEKNIINALVIWFIFAFFYRVSNSLLKKSHTSSRAVLDN